MLFEMDDLDKNTVCQSQIVIEFVAANECVSSPVGS